jgi:hypothetical protein
MPSIHPISTKSKKNYNHGLNDHMDLMAVARTLENSGLYGPYVLNPMQPMAALIRLGP